MSKATKDTDSPENSSFGQEAFDVAHGTSWRLMLREGFSKRSKILGRAGSAAGPPRGVSPRGGPGHHGSPQRAVISTFNCLISTVRSVDGTVLSDPFTHSALRSVPTGSLHFAHIHSSQKDSRMRMRRFFLKHTHHVSHYLFPARATIKDLRQLFASFRSSTLALK